MAQAATAIPDFSLTEIFVRIGTAGIAGACWWNYNIVYGNAVAIETLGIFAILPEYMRLYVIPIAGSMTQLYWDEELDLGVLRHQSVATFCVVVGFFDVLGPAYGFIVTQGFQFSIITIVFALIWSVFFSIICQEMAWRTIRDLILWSKTQITRKRVARGGRRGGRGGGNGNP